ncbi:MAG: penicillin-binding transpeptidase domain-containing protein [Eubacteriales bacterium]|nr:penicillin-binding transpeptidase domain-containing protein [Eubacteriales bacterium]
MKKRNTINNNSIKKKSRNKKTGSKPSSKWNAGIWFSSLILLVFCGYIITNLFNMQVLEFEVHAQEAAKYHYRKIVELPKRGSIYDSNGAELAFSSTVYTIGATPSDVISRKNSKMLKEDIASGISEALGMDPAVVLEMISDVDKTWIRLKKRAEKTEADALKEFVAENEIGGISFDEEEKRVYPEGNLAGTVIGFTSNDGSGQLGLELQYNNELTGTPGYTYTETDNYGKSSALPFAVPLSLRASDGYNVVTTIDSTIQKIVQTELLNSVKSYNVTEGGVAIVMDPYTGSILAMAGTTEFDPNAPTACPPGESPEAWDPTSEESVKYLSSNIWRNRAISDNYEPGSTFKAITSAMAMELGKFSENEIMNDAPIKVADRIINCYHKGGHGLETARQAFWNSCNPIFVQLSQRVGISKFYDFVRAFGFYEPTGIDLPGEGSGIFHADPAEIDMACLAFGEQSTVTPIAMINSYAAFANGGTLMKPRIVKSLTDSSGNIVKEIPPAVVRQVISEQTAVRVRNLLEGVVTYGTGSKGYVAGFHVGGKTSTSTRDDDNNVISFLSMAPISQPKICVLVILFAPEEEYARSSLVAKTSAAMTERILEYLDVPRDYSGDDLTSLNKPVKVPSLVGLTLAQAVQQLADSGINTTDPSGEMKNDSMIISQYPIKDQVLHKGGTISVFASDTPDISDVVVPDIRGKNINECINAMTESGINIIIDGECLGTADTQEFEPGMTVKKWSIMKVTFTDGETAD